MKTTEYIAELSVREQPQQIIVYHKILRLALALGAVEDRAEVLATSVSGHCRDNEPLSIRCEIDSTQGRHRLVISGSKKSPWQERIRLGAMPDSSVIEQQRQLLTDISMISLLLQMQARQDELQQQRNILKQETDRLSLELHRKNKDLEYQAMHDALTGLPNKQLLLERAKHALQVASRQNTSCCLMLVGINNFKTINDALGHQVGDLMLQKVASRLNKSLRSSDTLARPGGNEFAVLLFNNKLEQAEIVANKLIRVVSQPFELEGHALSVNISIGISEFPTHDDDFPGLLRRAGVAMYHAKKKKLDMEVYNPTQDEDSIERLSLLSDLNQAIETGELELYYQPQVLAAGDGMPSLEALIRWPHPEKGMIFPDSFIPMAEDSGLITPMTWWVMETAAAQCAVWHKAGLKVNVSINFPACCLHEADVVKRVADCIKRHALPDHALVLEITESMIMDDPHQVSKVLVEINAMKVDVAIDDFGTGHSSLAYLKYLEVDELKIDRSFVMGMHEHNSDMVIVRTVINMAHNMGLRVVGEGVEDRQIWNTLAELGCDRMQGYFICRPQTVERISCWLEEFSRNGLQLDDAG